MHKLPQLLPQIAHITLLRHPQMQMLLLVLSLTLFLPSFLWLIITTTAIFRWIGIRTTPGTPPGNRGLPFIGETLQFMAAINGSQGFYDFVRVRKLKFGNCFKTNIFGQINVFVSSTESAKAILNNESGRFAKRYIRSIGTLVGDQSLLCASPHDHKVLRNWLATLFSGSSLGHFVKQFDELTVDAIRTWKHKGSVVMLDEASKITFKAMAKMLVSLDGEDELEMMQKDVALVCDSMLAFPLRLPWTRFHKGLQARERIMRKLEKMMSQRRESSGGTHEDFLHQLLVAGGDKACTQSDIQSLSDAQIKDNILTMIIAGQDTTASAITWMVKYLDENPRVLDTLRAEQLSLVKSSFTLEDLNEMPYASKVVKESLRMASIVPWFPRLLLADSEIHGYRMRKGWSINVDARSIHLDPTLYIDPTKFDPSRFDEESKPYSFLAFGQGGRTCLGMNLARAMMLIFLHRLVTTYRWEVTDSDSSVEKWAIFSRLKSGCPVNVMPIDGGQEVGAEDPPACH